MHDEEGGGGGGTREMYGWFLDFQQVVVVALAADFHVLTLSRFTLLEVTLSGQRCAVAVAPCSRCNAHGWSLGSFFSFFFVCVARFSVGNMVLARTVSVHQSFKVIFFSGVGQEGVVVHHSVTFFHVPFFLFSFLATPPPRPPPSVFVVIGLVSC